MPRAAAASAESSFETREGVALKKLARAHQYRAANKLVKRVVEGELKRGIVWHATGSGKSLTMVFAARKLQRVGLGDPTVLLVIDRSWTPLAYHACLYTGVLVLMGVVRSWRERAPAPDPDGLRMRAARWLVRGAPFTTA